MKKTLLALLALILTLASCRVNAPVAQQSGKEDTAFLLFISGGEYAGKEVTVTIDGTTPFTAKVVKQKKAARFGTQYAVATGPHAHRLLRRKDALPEETLPLHPGDQADHSPLIPYR